MDTGKSKELWERLEYESERAYRAFESFLTLPSGERTLTAAYQHHVGSPAAKPSDTWTRWSSSFAWRERAAAYDDHMASKRREAYERGIEEEAERQGALAERNRNRMNELMTLGYEPAMEWFENTQPSDLRAQDVMQIIRLHMDYLKAFDVDRESKNEADWTDEDDAEFDAIVKEVDALTDLERPEYEEGDGESSGEDHSEESEGEET
jgi:hypothetical protein